VHVALHPVHQITVEWRHGIPSKCVVQLESFPNASTI